MHKRAKLAIMAISLVCVALTGGCGSRKVETVVNINEPVPLIAASYEGVDQLLQSPSVSLEKGSKVVTATFVDLDDVTTSSKLGRLFGECSSSRLTQKGYDVVALKLRNDSIVIQPGIGQFVLSRDMALLKQKYCADAVLVGMYTRTRVDTELKSVNKQLEDADSYYDAGLDPERKFVRSIDSLYVSLRLISTQDSSIIAAWDYWLPCDDGINSLMGAEGSVFGR
ncbi:MAG TPA: hypothetical protein ENL03_06715 [Phycisphaerae bacterium]|nr:hypothetical protein [Phycisphaerae bacterium]